MARAHGLPASATRRIVVGVVTVLSLLVAASPFACGTDAIGVDACKKIEKARCESAQACGISLEQPAHAGDSPEQNVASCIRYYDDQCLHGIAGPKEPPPQQVDLCVKAIIEGDCSVVRAPESNPACLFLVPPQAAPTPDAAADASPG